MDARSTQADFVIRDGQPVPTAPACSSCRRYHNREVVILLESLHCGFGVFPVVAVGSANVRVAEIIQIALNALHRQIVFPGMGRTLPSGGAISRDVHLIAGTGGRHARQIVLVNIPLNGINAIPDRNILERVERKNPRNGITTRQFGNHVARVRFSFTAQMHSLSRRNVNPVGTHYIYLCFSM